MSPQQIQKPGSALVARVGFVICVVVEANVVVVSSLDGLCDLPLPACLRSRVVGLGF